MLPAGQKWPAAVFFEWPASSCQKKFVFLFKIVESRYGNEKASFLAEDAVFFWKNLISTIC